MDVEHCSRCAQNIATQVKSLARKGERTTIVITPTMKYSLIGFYDYRGEQRYLKGLLENILIYHTLTVC